MQDIYFYHHCRLTSQPWLPVTVVQYVLFAVAESKKKTAQVIRKQTNTNSLFFSLPSSSNKATSHTVNHTTAITCLYQKPCTCYFFCCVWREEKNLSPRVSHHKIPAESIVIFATQGISRCWFLITHCRFLEEGMLTRERSRWMFDPNICWLRRGVFRCNSFNFKM